MGSYRRAVALVTLLALVPGARAAYPDDEGASLAEEIAKAMPDAEDDAHHKLQFGLELFDAVHTGLAMFEIDAAIVGTTGAIGAGSTAGTIGVLGIAAEVVAPLAAEGAVLLALGNAHAIGASSRVTQPSRLRIKPPTDRPRPREKARARLSAPVA
jgi:hypothetical protein